MSRSCRIFVSWLSSVGRGTAGFVSLVDRRSRSGNVSPSLNDPSLARSIRFSNSSFSRDFCISVICFCCAAKFASCFFPMSSMRHVSSSSMPCTSPLAPFISAMGAPPAGRSALATEADGGGPRALSEKSSASPEVSTGMGRPDRTERAAAAGRRRVHEQSTRHPAPPRPGNR